LPEQGVKKNLFFSTTLARPSLIGISATGKKTSVDGDEKRSSLISSIFGSQHGFNREFIKRQKTLSSLFLFFAGFAVVDSMLNDRPSTRLDAAFAAMKIVVCG
jgi:hypothetical protein